MITEASSVYTLPSFIDAEPLFKQIKEYTYNSKSPLLQANSHFVNGPNRYPAPWVKPQAVKDAVEHSVLSSPFNLIA
ncbi:MAG: hypothetical protein PHP44_03885 [Kiritimatiellae bacterium]|nr:hypothetical protein [Kiritimatiellia bacterium]MDD4735229.1 hypothetical protein [Kiritimatiellia bacterium]